MYIYVYTYIYVCSRIHIYVDLNIICMKLVNEIHISLSDQQLKKLLIVFIVS